MARWMNEINVSTPSLAMLIWLTALLAGALTFIPNSSDRPFEQWLAALACIALIFVGYTMVAQQPRRTSNGWQATVWVGTFLLVLIFFVRALLRHGA
jgi:FtsH-binding integral membrane protein